MKRKRMFIRPTKRGFAAFRKRYAYEQRDQRDLVMLYAGFLVGVEHERNGGKQWFSVVRALSDQRDA